MQNYLIDTFILILAFLPAVVLHEISHGLVAYLLGDNTAKVNGRLSLNPIKHLDLFGIIAFFIIHIGWAKPVPVNSRNFKHPKRDSAIVALAGPLANLLLAFIGAFLFVVFYYYKIEFLHNYFNLFMWINVVLMIFNLIPIPPLDGSKIARFFVPKEWSAEWFEYEKHGPIILFTIIGVQMFFHVPIFYYVIFWPANKLLSLIMFSIEALF